MIICDYAGLTRLLTRLRPLVEEFSKMDQK